MTRSDCISAINALTSVTGSTKNLFNILMEYMVSNGDVEVVNAMITVMTASASHDVTSVPNIVAATRATNRGNNQNTKDKTVRP